MNQLTRFISCFLLVGTAISAFGHSAVEPAPRTDQGWVDRQKVLNERATAAGEKAKVIFIGDSITQGWEGAGKQVWEKYYSPRNAVNLGIGGDRTQHVLWRLENGNLNTLKPKAAVVMIGTNNSNNEDNTPSQIADGVGAIVHKLREKLPMTKIILVAIFPRNENPSPQRGKVLQVNQIIRKLADDQNVFWADFGHEFVDSQGLIPHDLMPDYLHLSPGAYSTWAAAIEGRLSSILGDTPVVASTVDALSGDWIWTINGPEGKPVSSALVLKRDGNIVTGKFARDETRWLEIQNGKISGNEFSWTIRRDRSGGEFMTYEMTGKVENGKITGTAKTQFNGQPVTSEWSAVKK